MQQRIREYRTIIDDEDAAKAKVEFSENFSDYFFYSKRKEKVPLSRTSDIARHYRKLKNCPRWWD